MADQVKRVYMEGDKPAGGSPTAKTTELVCSRNGRSLTFKLSELTKDIQKLVLWYGLSQITGDASAGAAKKGLDPLDFMEAKYQNLKDGVFRTKREGVGGPSHSMLAEAYRRAKVAVGVEMDISTAAKVVSGWTPEQRKAYLAQAPQLAAAYKQVRDEAEARKRAAVTEPLDISAI